MAKPVVVGKIGRHFGVKGWLKIQSFTRPEEQIFEYQPWMLEYPELNGQWQVTSVTAKERRSGYLIAKLEGFDSRESSAPLIGREIAVDEVNLPVLDEGEYYWSDLIGLDVTNLQGVVLGRVEYMMETGANDVMAVKHPDGVERLIPWVAQYVDRVDLDRGILVADWPEDY